MNKLDKYVIDEMIKRYTKLQDSGLDSYTSPIANGYCLKDTNVKVDYKYYFNKYDQHVNIVMDGFTLRVDLSSSNTKKDIKLIFSVGRDLIRGLIDLRIKDETVFSKVPDLFHDLTHYVDRSGNLCIIDVYIKDEKVVAVLNCNEHGAKGFYDKLHPIFDDTTVRFK